MRVLTFGWEFPPHNSGGLGVACEGLTKALAREGTDVLFVLPKKIPVSSEELELIFADVGAVEQREIYGDISPYTQPQKTSKERKREGRNVKSAGTPLIERVREYGDAAAEIASMEEFDIIHAHDWLSFCAGIRAKEASDKPLVVHVHATEFDRTGGHGVNQDVYRMEQAGMKKADRVITVSKFTKSTVVDEYGIDTNKVDVVHNGIDEEEVPEQKPVLKTLKEKGNKIVLFLGRKTIQKGPDHFLDAAKRICDVRDDFYFVMAGSGDMENKLVEQAAQLGIADKVLFTGFLRGEKFHRMYQSADVYVMPSISEPFGITPLESLMHDTPVVISNQSGVSEVLSHALRVDFWDTNDMADKIMAAAKYDSLNEELTKNGKQQVRSLTWQKAAKKCLDTYNRVLQTT